MFGRFQLATLGILITSSLWKEQHVEYMPTLVDDYSEKVKSE